MESEKPQTFKAWTVRLSASSQAREIDVVWLPQEAQDKSWMQKVSKDSKTGRTIFLRQEADRFLLSSFGDALDEAALKEEIRAASHVLLEQSGLSPNSEVCLQAGGQLLTVKLKPQKSVTGKEDIIRSDAALEELIREDNEKPLNDLVSQLRSPLGVIPFVGAGMSKTFNFPEWGDFLRSIAEKTKKVARMEKRIAAGEYETVAEALWKSDPDVFQKEIERIYDVQFKAEQLKDGPLSVLAELVNGPVVTTNFDHILEDTFAACDNEFEETIFGPQPDRIVKAIHLNSLALLKIHGDYKDRTSRTFTAWEYKRSYKGKDPKQITVSRLGWLVFTRPLLFLGSSLVQDRTVQVLQEIHQTVPGLIHFAIIAAHYSDSQLRHRRETLAAAGISPIWFAPQKFGRIKEILLELLDRVRSKEIYSAPPLKKKALPSGKNAVAKFEEVAAEAVPPMNVNPVINRIADAITGGRVAFFLGAYAHLAPELLGNPFYEHLAQTFGAPDPKRDRSEIARYVIDTRGPQALWGEIKRILSLKPKTSIVYEFLAALPGFLRAKKREAAASLFILTTNYDTKLEEIFQDEREPFHLFYYNSGDEYEGKFAYRLPNGTEKIIERPENFRQLPEQGSIIVKLNGGEVYGKAIPESVMIAQGDFARLAGRLPDVLPEIIRRSLVERSLLFLGHGLNEPDVEALLRYAAGQGTHRESWAVQKGVDADWIKYWDKGGLQIIESDLQEFMVGLHGQVAQALSSAAPALAYSTKRR